MIGVTNSTARDSQRDHDGSVGTVVEEIRLHGVTLSADIPYPRDPRRRRAVIAMAVVAGRRRQIALRRHQFPVNALLILFDLIGRNLVPRHVVFIGVTATASFGDTSGMHR
jgi:hypothetical protein